MAAQEPERLIEAGGVTVWQAHGPADAATIERCRSVLSPTELTRADRFVVEPPRSQFVVARATLRVLLGDALHIDPQALAFEIGQFGKPSLIGHDLQFNVSHSGDVVLVAIGRQAPLGVDVETERPHRDFLRLAQRFFAPGEVARLESVPESERAAAFYRCWTRKEAYLKARGTGITLGLDTFEVAFLPCETEAVLRTPPDDGPENWNVFAVEAAPGHAAALIVARED